MNTHSSPARCIEPLEDRVAPAGVIGVVYDPLSGLLTLTGDADANSVFLFPTGPASHRLVGRDTTTFTGGDPVVDLGKVTSIVFDGGAGNDRLDLFDLSALSSVRFDGGTENDSLFFENVAVKGNVTFNGGSGSDGILAEREFFRIGGSLEMTGADSLHLSLLADTQTIGGGIQTSAGTGSSTLVFSGFGLKIGKGIRVDAGLDGSDIIFQTQGTVRLGKLPTGESILLNGSSDQDEISIRDGTHAFSGGIRLLGGNGFNQVSVEPGVESVKLGKFTSGESILLTSGNSSAAITIEAPLSAAGGIGLSGQTRVDLILAAGNGKIALGKTASGESIRMEGGGIAGGGDGATLRLATAVLKLAGGILFDAGDGNNVFEADSPGSSFSIGKLPTGESIKYIGGNSNDEIFTNVASLKLAGAITFAGGDGSNKLRFLGAGGVLSVGKLASGESLVYSGGAGSDELRAEQGVIAFAGGIAISGGDGLNRLDFMESGIIRLGATLTRQSVVFTGGAGNDAIEFAANSMVAAGAIVLQGGEGNDSLSLTGRTILGKDASGDSARLIGDDGNDALTLDSQLKTAGSITVIGGGGNDRINTASRHSMFIGGDLRLDGGPGADQMNMESQLLKVARSVKFSGDDGSDSFRLVANGSIGGDVTIELGDETDLLQTAVLESSGNRLHGLIVRGLLVVSATGLGGDQFTLTNVVIGSSAAVDLGPGSSTVVMDNFSIAGQLTMTTGSGSDTVSIERENLFGSSVIGKLASINLGDGDDSLLIGSPLSSAVPPFPDSTRVRFLGPLLIDSGTGVDTRNDIVGENDTADAPTGLEPFENTIP